MNRILVGAIAGTVGTWAMTMCQQQLFRTLPLPERYPLPPREITEALVTPLSGTVDADDASTADATLASHFAFGAGVGALFTALGLHARRPVAHGIGWGLAVWAGSYLGWIPLFRILRPATKHPMSRNALMLAAHVVWGGVTGLAAAGLMRSDPMFRKHGVATSRDAPAFGTAAPARGIPSLPEVDTVQSVAASR